MAPEGWCLAKSCLRNPRASRIAIASASPIASSAVVLAVGASIGSPGTPGIGIVILSMLLGTIGIPASGIALTIGVDRILDMCRTSVNVTGDLIACTVLDKSNGGIPDRKGIEE